MTRWAADGYRRPPVDTADPRNVESDLTLRGDPLTATDRFFVRSHFPMPEGLGADARLVVDGLVDRPLSFTLADIMGLADETRVVTLECAGNGRAHLDPPIPGVQWVGGAVGTASWLGVRMGRLLEMAGIGASAVAVVAGGADAGEVTDATGTRRRIRYERGIPLEKALQPEVLVAVGMNERPLSRQHGGPLRAVIGGWYGMASVKWLTQLTVVGSDPTGHWETVEYSIHEGLATGERTRRPVREMQPKAQIIDPPPDTAVRVGHRVCVRGLAWAGEGAVSAVDLSTDGGTTWEPARLIDPPFRFGWTRWEAGWTPDAAGDRGLLARCRDDRGRVQPLDRDPDRGSYLISEVVPYPVRVIP